MKGGGGPTTTAVSPSESHKRKSGNDNGSGSSAQLRRPTFYGVGKPAMELIQIDAQNNNKLEIGIPHPNGTLTERERGGGEKGSEKVEAGSAGFSVFRSGCKLTGLGKERKNKKKKRDGDRVR